MVRPVKYLIVEEYRKEEPASSELANLPLDAISGITKDDIPDFNDVGIETIEQLSDTEFQKKEMGDEGPSDYKLNHGISYAIDIMIQTEEPGVHDEIMPIDELLDRKYEKTPDNELGDLGTVAIEGVAPGNAKKLKKVGLATIKELSEADLDKVKSAELRDWEAEKFLQYAIWIMQYAKINIEKPDMENIGFELKDNMLILTIDVTKEFGNSSSGKTIIVASSHGNHKIKGTDLVLGAFAYKWPTKKEAKGKKKVKEAQNVEIVLDGDIATLTMDTTKDYGSSASGKSTIVASTRGNKTIAETEVLVGLNLYKPKKK